MSSRSSNIVYGQQDIRTSRRSRLRASRLFIARWRLQLVLVLSYTGSQAHKRNPGRLPITALSRRVKRQEISRKSVPFLGGGLHVAKKFIHKREKAHPRPRLGFPTIFVSDKDFVRWSGSQESIRARWVLSGSFDIGHACTKALSICCRD